MADRIGQQLGHYRLLSLLGEGGFAEVYLGEHIHLGTQAAIKVLYTRLASDDIEQFRAEARTIARLVHPHIVRVLDFGIEEHAPYLVMDYAPNGTLRTRHPRGAQLPLATVVTYVQQIADALQYAHDQRLIHRDIKPENMLLGRSDEILLSDFGLALVAQSSRSQSPQQIAGTVAYMAPEQVEGHPRPASDQYALGVIVYEWLTGERPFSGSYSEIVAKHAMLTPPSLRSRRPALPPAVEEVVLRALAKDPKDRFESVRAFAAALEEASQPDQLAAGEAPPSTPTVQLAPQREHRPGIRVFFPGRFSGLRGAASSRELTRQARGAGDDVPGVPEAPNSPSVSSDLLPTIPATQRYLVGSETPTEAPSWFQAQSQAPPLAQQAARLNRSVLLIALVAVVLVAGIAGVVLFAHKAGTGTAQPTPTIDRHGLQTNIPLPDKLSFKTQNTAISGSTIIDEWFWTVASPSNPAAVKAFYQQQLPANGWTHLQIIPANNGNGALVIACQKSQVMGALTETSIPVTNNQGKTIATITAPAGGAALEILLTSDHNLVKAFCSNPTPTPGR